nr:MAG TPA: hypothetical protein [Caudoviricetes sp.]
MTQAAARTLTLRLTNFSVKFKCHFNVLLIKSLK